MGLAEAWNMYKVIGVHDKIYMNARFGVHIKFDINDYLKGRILTKPKSGKALIRGKAHELILFETELEVREKILKEWLMENYVEDPLIKSRGEV